MGGPEDVVAISVNDVWVVGSLEDRSYNRNGKDLAMHWDGVRWKNVQTETVCSYVGPGQDYEVHYGPILLSVAGKN